MKREIKIGITGIIALVMLFFGMKFLKGVKLFNSSNLYYITFRDAKGLSKSSTVYADGYDIGIVSDVSYDYNHPGTVVVEISVNGDVREGSYAKILAGYHQYYAVEKAAVRTEEAVKGDGKIGVFWHTQGSGKSLSMVFLAHHPRVQAMNPTIVVITDRNDLDEQLFGQFSRTVDFLRQRAVQCTSRNAEGDDTSLKAMLKNRHSGGIIFTTMQKFDDWDGALSDRQNIIVMTDEAHRGQYGMEEKVDTEGNVPEDVPVRAEHRDAW